MNKRIGSPIISNRKLIYNRGINDYDGVVKINGQHITSYKIWRSMFNRCYANNDIGHIRAYKGAEVCKEWWSFSVFLEWYNEHYIAGNVLEKDICNNTNKKLYCPQNCAFVPQEINNLISNGGVQTSKYPRGVSKAKTMSNYNAKIFKHGKTHILGVFKTIEEARCAYVKAKLEYIKEQAQHYYDIGKIEKRVYDALMNYKIE